MRVREEISASFVSQKLAFRGRKDKQKQNDFLCFFVNQRVFISHLALELTSWISSFPSATGAISTGPANPPAPSDFRTILEPALPPGQEKLYPQTPGL